MYADFDFDSISSGYTKQHSVWILTETKLQSARWNDWLTRNSEKNTALSLTIGGVVFKILSKLHARRVRRLSDIECLLLLNKIISEKRDVYPLHFKRCSSSIVSAGIFPDELSSLKKFLDAVRLCETTEQLLWSLIDEFGNTKTERKRLEEAVYILAEYQERARVNVSLDYVSAVDLLLEIVGSATAKTLIKEALLPELIILDQALHLYPLERSLWQGLSGLVDIQLLVDEELQELATLEQSAESPETLPAQFRYAAGIVEFIAASKTSLKGLSTINPVDEQRRRLVSSIFSWQAPEVVVDENILVLDCSERRDEVRRVASLIKQALLEATAKPGDFQIVALDLDIYGTLFEAEFEELGIPLSIPKGYPLWPTTAAQTVTALVDWYCERSVEAWYKYFSSSTVVCTGLSYEIVEEFISKLQQAHESLVQFTTPEVRDCLKELLEAESAKTTFPKARLVLELFERLDLGAPLVADRKQIRVAVHYLHGRLSSVQHLKRPEAKSSAIREICLTLIGVAALDRELTRALADIERHDVAQLASVLRKRFVSERMALSNRETMLALQASKHARLRNARESRQVARVFRATERILREFVVSSELREESAQVLRNVFLRHLRASYLAAPLNTAAVTLTEMLDVRGVRDKQMFVVGVTEEALLKADKVRTELGARLDELSLEVHNRTGRGVRMLESNWLFGHLLRHSKRLVITVPALTGGSEAVKAGIVRDIESCLDLSAEGLGDGQELACMPVEVDAEKRARLVSKRLTAELNEYNGRLPSDAWSQLMTKLPSGVASEDATTNYSVSKLEQAADCRHRFFFSTILGLTQPETRFSEEMHKHVGILVHKSLELFFKSKSYLNKAHFTSNFSEACREVKRIAERLMRASPIDWDLTAAFRAYKQRVIQGLDDRSEDAKRGLLKAALVYERDVIETEPSYLEYRFSEASSAAEPLVLESTSGHKLIVSGVIDRIDESKGGAMDLADVAALWDYKTSGSRGRVSELEAGRLLQIPIYGALVAQNSRTNSPPKRGGLIMLSPPNRRDEELRHPRKGVVVEQLAIAKKGLSYVLDDSAVEGRIEAALSKVRELDAKVRSGEFEQQLDTKACEICEFKSICARNETLIEARDGEAEVLPEPIVTSKSVTTKLDSRASQPKLSPEQVTPTDISKNVVLVAGAGSGKTAVLRARVLELLLAGIPVESILAITFTEKAAFEIRSRIEDAIRAALNTRSVNGCEITQAQAELLSEARSGLRYAQIGTIHAFLAKVVSMNSELSGVSRESTMLSVGEVGELIEQAVDELLLEQLRNNEQTKRSLEHVLESGVSVTSLRIHIASLVRKAKQLEEIEQLFREFNSGKKQASKLYELIQNLRDEIEQQTFADARALVSEWLTAATEWFECAGSKQALNDTQQQHFSHVFDELYRFMEPSETPKTSLVQLWELRDYLNDHSKAASKRVSKAHPRNFWKELRDELNAFSFEIVCEDSVREEEALELASSVVVLARAVLERYEYRKRVQGALDFDDLIFCAHRMLVEKASSKAKQQQQQLLRERLRKRFHHVMVDEFQDTDIHQWEIIRSICALAGTSADEAEDEAAARSVFIVGDKKQAIYSFRGGDVRVFERASAEIVNSQGIVATLKDNYRSQAEIVSFINSFFDVLLGVEFEADSTPRVRTAVEPGPMQAKRERGAVSVLFSKSSAGARRSARDLQEAENVAGYIRSVLSELDTDHKRPQIAVLTRTVKQLNLVARACEIAKLPFSISHSSGFFQLEEICQIENLFRVLENPSDEIALVGVLRSSLIGLSDIELVELYIDLEGNWSQLFVEDVANQLSPKFRELHQLLLGWRTLAALQNASLVVEQVLSDSGLSTVYASCDRSEAFTNIERLVDLLRESELQGQLQAGLRDVLRWFSLTKSEYIAPPSANNTANPVVLTTIHGAKGLEFPVVILPFLSRNIYRPHDFLVGELECLAESKADETVNMLAIKVEDQDQDYRRTPTLLNYALERSIRAQERSEERRLFYVACTRARDHLVLGLRQERDFAKTQKRIQDQPQANRLETVFESESPAMWFRNICEVDDVDSPTKWLLEDSNGKTIELPIIAI